MRVTIMQPYFIPYLGYFRLFAVADVFVALDCVQFPRRGWVHRNRLCDANGTLQWMTLPLQRGDRDTTRICDLQFADSLSFNFESYCRRFISLRRLKSDFPTLTDSIFTITAPPIDYLIQNLALVSELLGVARPILRSSSLNIPSSLKGQDRVIEIAKRIGAKKYINAPGGRGLYEKDAFEQANIALNFLPDYEGNNSSIVERLATDSLQSLRAELSDTASFHLR